MFHVTLSGLVKILYSGDQTQSLISQMGNPSPGSMSSEQLARFQVLFGYLSVLALHGEQE